MNIFQTMSYSLISRVVLVTLQLQECRTA